MRDLDEFLLGFRDKEKQVPQSFVNTIKRFPFGSNEIIYRSMNYELLKKIALIIITLIAGASTAFAVTKIYENTNQKVCQKPEKIENLTEEITNDVRQINITEEEARKIAVNKLNDIGFNANIIRTEKQKSMISDTINFRFYTEDNYLITINGKTGEFYDIWNKNENIQNENITITEKEAIEKAIEYYKLFGFKDGEYELANIWCNRNETDEEGMGFKIDITFCKKYGDTFNPYESVSMSIESKNKDFAYIRVEDIPFDNNEVKISEEQAIKIALNEDKKVESRKIVDTNVQKKVVMTNTEAYKRINNYEKYYNDVLVSDMFQRDYYTAPVRVRNAWIVTITYKYESSVDDDMDTLKSQYSYYVDCTTGELIGGEIR